MNKSAIQKYAVWARTEMIAQIEQRAYQYGITADSYGVENAVTVQGRALSNQEQEQRWELIQQIKRKGYTQVVEEVAYTWFNRFIALRFMEVNNYLPTHIRVFSDNTGAFKPEILASAMQVELADLDRVRVAQMIDANQTEELYRYLLLTQCNALNEALPKMFEKMGGYSELLLPNNILRADGILGRMVNEIPEEDWTDQVQIIGWLYQYYNSELKDDTFALLKKKVKVTKERLPSATQLFTPDWIVRYMVENSLGRLWVEGHPNEELVSCWMYYQDEADQEAKVQLQIDKMKEASKSLKPQDIKFIDPCMGSGHILVCAFDVLVQIYKTYGISERDAAKLILENNLYGLDIDDRAAQLAYFAVMMKARQYDRRIFSRNVQPNVFAIQESNSVNRRHLKFFGMQMSELERNLALNQINVLLDTFEDAKEYGSLLNIKKQDWELLYRFVLSVDYSEQMTLDAMGLEDSKGKLYEMVKIAAAMAQKYDVVATNPPYMAISNASVKLYDFVKKNYPNGKSDLFASFMEKCSQLVKRNGIVAMITMQSWMFLSSYEVLRNKTLSTTNIISMLHLGIKAFEEIGNDIVQTVAFVARNSYTAHYKGVYYRLLTHDRAEKEYNYLHNIGRYETEQHKFACIPGSPVAYWASETIRDAFSKKSLYERSESPSQNVTGNNERYVRKHWELDNSKIGGRDSWIFYAKGGGYRKWWGNLTDVVNWTPEARQVYQFGDGVHASQIINKEYWYKKGITWGLVTTGIPSFRIMPEGATFDKGGSTIIVDENVYEFTLGLLNSKVYLEIVAMLNPTLNFQVKDVRCMPLILQHHERITKLVRECIAISKDDWDAGEISWEFQRHFLANSDYNSSTTIEAAFDAWKETSLLRFASLKTKEEELNQMFIEIYNLSDQLVPDIEEKYVSARRADIGVDIRGLISYAVGCMFGRYSLDEPGLIYAGGEWHSEKYSSFIPVKSNIIPICDDDYFNDDITTQFIKWVEVVYGKDTLEENLKFIATALGGKGTPRQIIRDYFLNEFYADHCDMYSVVGSGKKPVYWLFDSGKKNGFKALIYMHRYQSDLLARMRTDYVHEMQERYRTQLAHLSEAIPQASTSERVKLNKQLKKIQDQALELQKYEEKIHHLADQNISIDLDDGVKHNYALFGDVLAKIK